VTAPPAAETRFAFGENWRRFLAELDEEKIATARAALRDMLGLSDLEGRSFLDVGSGSGLHSLAARQLGARVHSFDHDEGAVACTRELRGRHRPDDADWTIEQGSALDAEYLGSLGDDWSVVYAWGVLHHTGDQWKALSLVAERVAPGGRLFVALYNDQGWRSRAWLSCKRAYNALPRALRFLVVAPAFVRLWGPTFVRDALRLRPLRTWRAHGEARGMSAWRDVIDWVGGLPFEVARPEEVLDHLRPRGFELVRLKTCLGGYGCNELVFRRSN